MLGFGLTGPLPDVNALPEIVARVGRGVTRRWQPAS
jgi:hypothetical protein